MRPIVHALLSGAIDYAGLFPPAALDLDAAVERYRQYRSGPDAWLLGRFVVPASRLSALADAIASRDPRGSSAGAWRVSVLVGDDIAADAAGLRTPHPGLRVEAVEVRATNAAETTRVAQAFGGIDEIWVEVTPGADLPATLAAIRGAGAGAKLRTGGVQAVQFPSAETVAAFLLACVRIGIPFKATAGLHHAVRGAYRLTDASDSPQGAMFGFLNVILASALAQALVSQQTPDPDARAAVVALLDETEPAAFDWEDRGVSWRGHRFDTARLVELRRRAFRSFGSCSFEEPIAELAALGLL